MKRISIFLIILVVLAQADFTRINGIVKDLSTGLEWQDSYNANGDAVKVATWENSITYCTNLGSGGWRLPNIRELNSITDLSTSSPTINSIFQNVITTYPYWSSTSSHQYPDTAYIVNFLSGSYRNYSKRNIENQNLDSFAAVRCVRGN